MRKMLLVGKIYQICDHVKFFGLRKLYYLLLDARMFLTNWQWRLAKHKNFKLIRSYNIDRLRHYFDGDEGHNLARNDGSLGFGLIHYCLVRNLKPKRVLCVGSRKGFIPAILAMACKENRFGQVDFVDAGFGKETPGKRWSGIGFWKKTNPNKHFSQIGVENYIDAYIITSQQFAQKFPKRKYGYVYIDGDHSLEGIKKDYGLFWPRIYRGGFMVFHDVVAKGRLEGAEYGVWKFWNQLKGNKITFPFPKVSGLGIIQK